MRRNWISLAAGAAALAFLSQGCGGPQLEPWHTEELTSEFTAGKAEEVRSLDDFLRLEDRLFAELDAKVYRETGTGPEYALVRYSAGSAADPEVWDRNWNRSFEFSSAASVGGVLLLHGLTDAPYTMRTLGETLHEQGYHVVGLRLPGHGTAPSGLVSVTWEDMAAAVRIGMAHLASSVGERPIHIVGYSTGAPLALDYALRAVDGTASPSPASLVLISPAIGVHAVAALAAWRDRLAVVPGLDRLAWLQILPEFDPYKYNSFATNAGAQVHGLTRSVAGRIATLTGTGETMPPILVFKSTVDATVSTDAVVDDLLARLEPNRHELVLFDINRFAVESPLLVADPAPFTDRLLADDGLPFAVTLVTNESPESASVHALHQAPFSAEADTLEPLDLRWPPGVLSLSHVALPFPPDDPLYGQDPPGNADTIFLGQLEIQGERGVLKLPADWLLRLRYNPFYDYLEARTLAWIEAAGGGPGGER